MSGNGNTVRRLRCAIYTRKSTEEGLDQDFNSLDAQREACAAYIASQASLGWKLVPDRYDDGGISGGTMERPALQRLLTDVRERRIDVVVVYKIDRLTRSLSDFARIVEIFDEAEASFVSVTQQFNTTTSMGRLTLNMLLSFAQFEREVTAERIRDKIAASKKKGMWMGGTVPLGYRAQNRKLIVHEQEAEIVRFLFQRYLELKSVRALSKEAKAQGYAATLKETDDPVRLRSFCRGNLYHLLSNPIYVGKIRHRDQLHDGQHEPIVEPDVFAETQALLASQAPQRRSATNSTGTHLLTGLVRDENGDVLRSAHANKKGTRYRYYVSKDKVEGSDNALAGWRLPAAQLESVVEHQLTRVLTDRAQLSGWIQESAYTSDVATALDRSTALLEGYQSAVPLEKLAMLRHFIQAVELLPGQLTIVFDVEALTDDLTGTRASTTGAANSTPRLVRIECPFSLRRRGVEQCLILHDRQARAPRQDDALISLVLRAHLFLRQLTEGGGRSLSEVATLNNTDLSEVSRLLPLAFLAPCITETILSGTQPEHLTAQRLSRISDLPLSWARQQSLLAD
ncbi:recombinase family protein [Nitratireductor mangrovi]|uniref:Recombinase family protein n=1 Tax=Nitratireductor mangrovi TaxID=2599600 RepID=A0A5B8KY76_9HYPH|nr:recombinase family protein [Nitratireductor mangrovi]QDZ00575.1 recombinase family protein [Nitratireductor mangrovi]